MTTHVDPPWLDPESHRLFLNRIFPGQWDRASYEWYIRRAFNGRKNEVVVRAEGRQILSAMTLCYRQISVDGRPPLDVSVLSAGGTIPHERGRGHYEQMLQTALARAREKSCVALLGFVTRQNGSGKGLIRIGAKALPSFYIVSRDRAPVRHRARVRTQRKIAFAGAKSSPPELSGVPQARFCYPRREDWEQQFLRRPNAVRAVRLSHDSLALVESVRETDRLQWLSCPAGKTAASIASLAAASAAASRKFFMYTLDPRQASAGASASEFEAVTC